VRLRKEKFSYLDCVEIYIRENVNISGSFALNRVLISNIDSSYMDKYAKYEFIFINVVKSL
jgi:hypothetical protein